MATFYYTVPRKNIRPHMDKMPVLIAATSCLHTPSKRNPRRLLVPNLPPHITDKGADCGGYAIATRFGGVWPYTLTEYLLWLDAYRPRWAAMPDLPCAVEKHSIGETQVRERQKNILAWSWDVWHHYQHAPWAWVPTIQGFTIEDYRRHAEMMAPLIKQMWAFYYQIACWETEDSTDEMDYWGRFNAFRVGIGGLVGRDNPAFVRKVVFAVQSVLGEMFPLHLWGVKLRYLKAGQALKGVVSYDSGAFDQRFGKDLEDYKGQEEMSQADVIWVKKQPAYAEKVNLFLDRPVYQTLWEPVVKETNAQTFREVIASLANWRRPVHACARSEEVWTPL